MWIIYAAGSSTAQGGNMTSRPTTYIVGRCDGRSNSIAIHFPFAPSLSIHSVFRGDFSPFTTESSVVPNAGRLSVFSDPLVHSWPKISFGGPDHPATLKEAQPSSHSTAA